MSHPPLTVRKTKDDNENDESDSSSVISGNLEDELEKPSFLRRLGRRRKDSDNNDEDSDSQL